MHAPYPDRATNSPYKCSRKLEDTLDTMLRRNGLKFGSGRTRIDVTPYSRYHALYGNFEELDSTLNEKLDIDDKNYPSDHNRPGSGENIPKYIRRAIDKIEVAEMRVRLPNHGKDPWVMVDKCQFNSRNRTLDTRLVFPDLTISGRVILHPSGGYCNMILRLRRAGIEFRTTPLDSSVPFGSGAFDSGRTRPASVRTDSHFSEPGFLSVFAHGCQGPTGIKFRKNSKRNRFDQNNYSSGSQRKNYYGPYVDDPIKRSGSRFFDHRRSANSMEWEPDSSYDYQDDYRQDEVKPDTEDLMNFNDEFLDIKEDFDAHSARTFGELFSSSSIKYGSPKRPIQQHDHFQRPPQQNWFNAELANSNEVSDALTRELEQLFSIGVRGLLTTYMQKALQPAIKETLMENMGYVLSYG